MKTSFYEFYKQVTKEKRISENSPAPAAAPGQPPAAPAQGAGQGTAPPANDAALQGIQKLWPQIAKLSTQIQDPALNKAFAAFNTANGKTLSGQPQAAPAPAPAAPAQPQAPAPAGGQATPAPAQQ